MNHTLFQYPLQQDNQEYEVYHTFQSNQKVTYHFHLYIVF